MSQKAEQEIMIVRKLEKGKFHLSFTVRKSLLTVKNN